MSHDKQPAARSDLTNDWVKGVCKIGQGHDCCRYLTMSAKGWDCEKHSEHKAYLDWRVATGSINARGDNCLGLAAEAEDSVQ